MVSHGGPLPRHPPALVAAAATEFAARGFDGAKVDRIAARAGVNKAMLYYHFPGKLGLYRAILADMFGAVADAVAAARHAGGTPEVQLRGFIHAIADQGVARPHFPSMWLREIAEGGRHVDDALVMQMRRVIETLAAISRTAIAPACSAP
jgi:TetR/AcrR family transcriptional regulator